MARRPGIKKANVRSPFGTKARTKSTYRQSFGKDGPSHPTPGPKAPWRGGGLPFGSRSA
jgi:hypothetical protein